MIKEKENATASCEVMTFQFSESQQPVRNVLIDNKPWFVAKDVCDVLGHTNPSVAIQGLDDDERAKESLGRQGKTWVVNESGLYALILRSNKPYAKTFRKWITSEVIPSLMKKGYYGVNRHQDGSFIDARNIPHQTSVLNGYDVRHIQIEGEMWYSINDLNRAIQSATGSNQLAKKLNVIEELAVKIWIFGNTHPAWFANEKGGQLIMSGSRINKGKFQLAIGGR